MTFFNASRHYRAILKTVDDIESGRRRPRIGEILRPSRRGVSEQRTDWGHVKREVQRENATASREAQFRSSLHLRHARLGGWIRTLPVSKHESHRIRHPAIRHFGAVGRLSHGCCSDRHSKAELSPRSLKRKRRHCRSRGEASNLRWDLGPGSAAERAWVVPVTHPEGRLIASEGNTGENSYEPMPITLIISCCCLRGIDQEAHRSCMNQPDADWIASHGAAHSGRIPIRSWLGDCCPVGSVSSRAAAAARTLCHLRAGAAS